LEKTSYTKTVRSTLATVQVHEETVAKVSDRLQRCGLLSLESVPHKLLAVRHERPPVLGKLRPVIAQLANGYFHVYVCFFFSKVLFFIVFAYNLLWVCALAPHFFVSLAKFPDVQEVCACLFVPDNHFLTYALFTQSRKSTRTPRTHEGG
jgi:hypothetical protein